MLNNVFNDLCDPYFRICLSYTPDENSLFLPAETTSISIFARDELVIPCRVTVPTTDITLFRPDGTVEDAVYDRERGFVINGSDTDPFQGTVQCRAGYENLVSWQAYNVSITSKYLHSVPATKILVVNRNCL